MAFTSVATVVTGQTYLASDYNTYIKDNMAALWPFTTAGDTAYASAATSLARLAIGAVGQIYRVNAAGAAPEWGALTHRRQGGSSTIWNTKGTTTYTPTAARIQAGESEIVCAADSGSVTITFPVAFSYAPIVFVGPCIQTAGSTRGNFVFTKSTESASSVKIEVYGADGLGSTFTVRFSWMAIGAP